MNKERYEGFTLLELLVVLVIIGLLVGVVAPNFFKNVDKSEIVTVKAQIDSLGKALDQYRLDVGRYPTSNEGLAALFDQPASLASARWNGPYLKEPPPKDPWGHDYQYRFPAKRGLDYDLFSYGNDGVRGGDGKGTDLGNW